MDQPSDFEAMIGYIIKIKNKALKIINNIKSYSYSCLERGFNSINEHDRTGL